MNKRNVLLFFCGLTTAFLASWVLPRFSYMDADYYLMGGENLKSGMGFNEWVLWNYLDDPQGLPHPSHGYWMPVASILAAGGMMLPVPGGASGARWIFLLLAGFLPPVTASLAFSLTRKESHALLAGLLAALPGFYLPFLTVPDTFAVYMLLGAVFLHIVSYTVEVGKPSHIGNRGVSFALLGSLAALLHLSRADGVLWLGIAGLVAVWSGWPSFSRVLKNGLFVVGGYSVLFTPWTLRNIKAFGVPLSPGGTRALWLKDYNELFSFPASLLSFSSWKASGIAAILQARGWALGQNLQTTLAVQGSIFLLPLIIIGLLHLKQLPQVKVGLLAWALTFLTMTFLFPFQGARGGFFHSGAAIQPLFWAVTPVGLDVLVNWGVSHRGWRIRQARRIFQRGLVVLAFVLTSILLLQRYQPGSVGEGAYRQVAEILETEFNSGSGGVVMVNNPPGFYLASHRPAIAVPDGGVLELNLVAQKYHVRFLILEPNHVEGLDGLYRSPRDIAGWRYLKSHGELQIYEYIP